MAGQSQSHTDGGLVGVHYRVVVNSTVIAKSDWRIVCLVDTKEDVDWLYRTKEVLSSMELHNWNRKMRGGREYALPMLY